MISANQFYTKKEEVPLAEFEFKQLESRIDLAYGGYRRENSSVMDSEENIHSPFVPDYKLDPEAETALREYGWKLEGDRICPIDKRLKDSANRKRFL